MLSLKVQAQAVGAYGAYGEGGAQDGLESSVGLHQGYAQLTNDKHWLRLGRQELAFGDQRMIGTPDWAMAPRAFDALRLHAEIEAWTLDWFGSVIHKRRAHEMCIKAPGESQARCARVDDGDYMSGFYATWKQDAALGLDLYVLYRHDGAIDTDLFYNRDIFSPGMRAFGSSGGVRYKAELIGQMGNLRRTKDGRENRRAHRAAALLAELGVALDHEASVVVAAGMAYATGEGTHWQEFDNFFAANHKVYGLSDLIGLRNLQQEYVTLTWTRRRRLICKGSWRFTPWHLRTARQVGGTPAVK